MNYCTDLKSAGMSVYNLDGYQRTLMAKSTKSAAGYIS